MIAIILLFHDQEKDQDRGNSSKTQNQDLFYFLDQGPHFQKIRHPFKDQEKSQATPTPLKLSNPSVRIYMYIYIHLLNKRLQSLRGVVVSFI